jgi:hypothetical protein
MRPRSRRLVLVPGDASCVVIGIALLASASLLRTDLFSYPCNVGHHRPDNKVWQSL